MGAGTELYKALFRGSSDGIVLLDRSSFRILEANVAASVMAGRPPESLAGLHLVDLVEPHEAERVDAALSATLQKGSSFLEISLLRPGQSGSRPISVHL